MSRMRRGRRCATRSSARRQPRVEPCSPEPKASPASSVSVIRPGVGGPARCVPRTANRRPICCSGKLGLGARQPALRRGPPAFERGGDAGQRLGQRQRRGQRRIAGGDLLHPLDAPVRRSRGRGRSRRWRRPGSAASYASVAASGTVTDTVSSKVGWCLVMGIHHTTRAGRASFRRTASCMGDTTLTPRTHSRWFHILRSIPCPGDITGTLHRVSHYSRRLSIDSRPWSVIWETYESQT